MFIRLGFYLDLYLTSFFSDVKTDHFKQNNHRCTRSEDDELHGVAEIQAEVKRVIDTKEANSFTSTVYCLE